MRPITSLLDDQFTFPNDSAVADQAVVDEPVVRQGRGLRVRSTSKPSSWEFAKAKAVAEMRVVGDASASIDQIIKHAEAGGDEVFASPAEPRSSVPVTVGSGRVTVYSGGMARSGTWTRAADTDPWTFVADDGTPILLTPGTTFVELSRA